MASNICLYFIYILPLASTQVPRSSIIILPTGHAQTNSLGLQYCVVHSKFSLHVEFQFFSGRKGNVSSANKNNTALEVKYHSTSDSQNLKYNRKIF